MKYGCVAICFCLLFGITITVNANSFLSAQKFPGTFSDLTFVDRVAVLRDGYSEWESEYDSQTGKCLTNCAYTGITIEEDMEIVRRNTELANQQMRTYLLQNPQSVVPSQPTTTVVQPVGIGGPISNEYGYYGPITGTSSGAIGQITQRNCTVFNPEIPINQKIPMGEPLMGRSPITSPYGKRIHPTTKNEQNHRGIDFGVINNTNIYTPASGVVSKVDYDKFCGNLLRIDHSDGYSTLYCHLNRSLVQVGDIVHAGCLVALSGNTGRSTGPHLHYSIYFNKAFINPTSMVGRN